MQEKIRIEKDPTAEKEADQFGGNDEKADRKAANAIAILNAKKGYVDMIVGVINPAMNIAFILCVPLLLIIGFLTIVVVSSDTPEKYQTTLDSMLKLFTLVVGIVIGAASARSKE